MQVNPACRDEHDYIFYIFLRAFPDLDLESRSGILVYLIRGSLVKNGQVTEQLSTVRIGITALQSNLAESTG